jgi:hypothetical protein
MHLFYLLQIKPLVGSGAGYEINTESIVMDDVILMTNKSMGNGVIDNIVDVIYVEPLKFDSLQTEKMAVEIEGLNDKMLKEERKYLLIGPGRWGTHDKFIGIPVLWPQISNAKIIVEISLPDFHLDASLGSHFFHNVTSMNVGYFSVDEESMNGAIFWDKLSGQQTIAKGEFFRHVRFEKPLLVRMDGKKRMAVVSRQK